MKPIQIGDVEARAPQAWSIRGVIGGVSMIWGPTGSYKTFLAIGMSVCVAAGRPWFGCQVRQGPVLYLLGEGGLDLFRRRAGMAAAHFGVDLRDVPLWVVPEAVDLSEPKRLEPLLNSWDHIAPVMVVIDTLSRSLPGDENKQETMQGFVSCMDDIRDRFDATVLALHHEGKDKQVRGSTVLPGAVDVSIRVEKHVEGAGDKILKLDPHKLRDLDTESFANKKLVALDYDVRDSHGALILDEYGDKVTTLVITAGEDFGELADRIVAAYTKLKGPRENGSFVGFKEWLKEWGGDLATFKKGLNHVLLHEEYDIVQLSPGQFDNLSDARGRPDNPFNPLAYVMPGLNWDTLEDEEKERVLEEITRDCAEEAE